MMVEVRFVADEGITAEAIHEAVQVWADMDGRVTDPDGKTIGHVEEVGIADDGTVFAYVDFKEGMVEKIGGLSIGPRSIPAEYRGDVK